MSTEPSPHPEVFREAGVRARALVEALSRDGDSLREARAGSGRDGYPDGAALYDRAAAQARRVLELLEAEPGIDPGPSPPPSPEQPRPQP